MTVICSDGRHNSESLHSNVNYFHVGPNQYYLVILQICFAELLIYKCFPLFSAESKLKTGRVDEDRRLIYLFAM